MSQKVSVETIMALEPGKIYFMEVKGPKDAARFAGIMKSINTRREIMGLPKMELPTIICILKDSIKFVEVPEGYEVVKTKGD